ncbi:transglycosylase domain-containing protein [Pelagibacterium sp.]|uniref:transglycosylase domain-containing protein n=1 Tax=Pelagibacterium sp. TaxID=1967288 RepID=UPI003A8E4A52
MAGRRKKRGWKFWIVLPLLLVAALVAIPLVLVPIYWVVPPVSTLMIGRFVAGQPVTRIWRDLDEISDRLKTSVVLSEDGQFCTHHGIDASALRAEIDNFLAGREARGASTITMQVARNLFLNNSRSVVRKGLEVPLAIYIDLVLPKRRIMEIYLNIAEWGPNGEFGIEAGAQAAFGTSAESFSWQRAALMTVTLPNPHVRRPGNPTTGLIRVAGIVEGRAQRFSSHANCLFDGAPAL